METVKTDLRISGSAHDSVLSAQYIPAAIAWAESATRRSLVSRTMALIIGRFPKYPASPTIILPGGKVTSIASIVYISNGAAVTMTGPDASPAGIDFQQSLGDSIARIMPKQGDSWPAVDSDAIDPVTITYSAGWATPAEVPADIKRAMTAHVYGSMELDGLLTIRPGFDIDHPEKLLSAYRSIVL
jgi:uncharacterized phiE125 gp8 family phage protein